MTTKLVYSAVAIPGEPDYDGEILTESEIQYAAHKFMSDYRIIDPEHVCALTNECINVGTPVESTILREPITVKSIHEGKDMNLPKGTWILGIEVTDDREWERIVTGEATGLSLTAARTTVKSRVLIRDLGKNWEAKTVSIVKDPAVPKAKFFQIIGDGMMNDEATKSRLQGFFDKIEEAVKNFKAEDAIVDEAAPEPIQEDVVAETVEEEASIKSEEAEAEEEAEPATEVQEEENIEEVDEEKTEEDIVEEEVVATESEEAEEAVKFVTADELQQTKEEILEAVQTLMQPATEDEAVKSEPEEEEEEEEETSKVDDEDLDEIRKKDLQIAELEKKIEVLEAKLKTANKSRSKGIPAHFNSEKRAVKNLYEDDNRDLYGRVIRR